MNLKEYCTTYPGSMVKLAKLVGVTDATISRWASGQRSPKPVHARRLVEATDGQVTLAELRPEIWG